MLVVPPLPDAGNIFQQLAREFVNELTMLLTTINSTVIEVSRLTSVSVLLIGLLLYFTRAERRLGKDLIKGGVLLAVLAEFILPQINRA